MPKQRKIKTKAPIVAPEGEKKTKPLPVYINGKILKKNDNERLKRRTRLRDHIYDLDLSGDPVIPFKKTRSGFKIKKVGPMKAEKQKGKVYNKRLELKEKQTAKFTEKRQQNLPKNAPVKSLEKELRVSVTRLRVDPLNCVLSKDLPQADSRKSIDIEQTIDESEIDILNISDIRDYDEMMPDNSTPIFEKSRVNKRLCKSKILGTPIQKISDKTMLCNNSPWRLPIIPSNRLQANFPIKDSLLPTYDKDVTLSHSVLESSPEKQLSGVACSESRGLLEKSFAPPSFVVSDSQNSSSISRDNTNTTCAISNIGKETERSRILNNDDMPKDNTNFRKEEHDGVYNLFGFDITNTVSTNALREHNKNAPQTTRISLREIKNLININQKPRNSNKENIGAINKIEAAIIKNIENEVDHNSLTSSAVVTEAESQANVNENKILLFRDLDEDLTTFKPDQPYTCYEPKIKNKHKNILKIHEKHKRQKPKNKLTTEEWIAAKKWEIGFNKMVQEVESFEMVIE